ncbi:hypothetical protein BMETH_2855_0 [methanotrophic bacterial endosymbiont of Bathymodiolus sp.]|nr:hypothetical protein BMETH_2855_0 [methanotrophic bacterial endosymbiont of Bathymodiolus sp.]
MLSFIDKWQCGKEEPYLNQSQLLLSSLMLSQKFRIPVMQILS